MGRSLILFFLAFVVLAEAQSFRITSISPNVPLQQNDSVTFRVTAVRDNVRNPATARLLLREYDLRSNSLLRELNTTTSERNGVYSFSLPHRIPRVTCYGSCATGVTSLRATEQRVRLELIATLSTVDIGTLSSAPAAVPIVYPEVVSLSSASQPLNSFRPGVILKAKNTKFQQGSAIVTLVKSTDFRKSMGAWGGPAAVDPFEVWLRPRGEQPPGANDLKVLDSETLEISLNTIISAVSAFNSEKPNLDYIGNYDIIVTWQESPPAENVSRTPTALGFGLLAITPALMDDSTTITKLDVETRNSDPSKRTVTWVPGGQNVLEAPAKGFIDVTITGKYKLSRYTAGLLWLVMQDKVTKKALWEPWDYARNTAGKERDIIEQGAGRHTPLRFVFALPDIPTDLEFFLVMTPQDQETPHAVNNPTPVLKEPFAQSASVTVAWSNVFSITPSVASNSPSRGYGPPNSKEPLHALITGKNFPSGGSVELGNDIQVGVAYFKSSTEIEVQLENFGSKPEGPRDVIVKDRDGKVVAIGKELFYVTSLDAALEVNQGVPMTCSDARPCIAGHDTVVRAKLVCNGLTIKGEPCEKGKDNVAGVLHISGPGGPLSGSPFRPEVRMTVLPANARVDDIPGVIRRSQAQESLNFYFTDADKKQLAAGQYDFSFELNPRNLTAFPAGNKPDENQSLVQTLAKHTFAESNVPADHNIGMYRLSVAKGAMNIAAMVDMNDAAANPPNTILGHFEMLYAAYPASRGAISVAVVPSTISWPTSGADPETIVQTQLRAWLEQNAASVTPPYSHLVFFSKRALDNGLSECGIAESRLLPNHWTCKARDVIVLLRGVDTAGSVAHEIGHNFDLGDTYQAGPIRNPKVNPLDAQGLCAAFGDGCPVETGNFDIPKRQVSIEVPQSDSNFRNVFKRDVMGNADRKDRWIDLRSWNWLYPLYNTPPPSTKGVETKSATGQDRAEGTAELVTVRGTVHSDGTASFLPFVRSRGTPPDFGVQDPAAPVGSYTLEVQNAGGQVLDARTFEPLFIRGHRTAPSTSSYFSERMALPDAAARFVIKKDGAELAMRRISANSPFLQFVSPGGETTLNEKAIIEWFASDPDGDALTYSLLYSTDAGRKWIPLAADIAGTTFEWNTSLAAGSTDARLRLVASDGFNETTATSGPITVARKAPYIVITSPASGATIGADDILTLTVSVYDLQDGETPHGGINFTSDRDGVLGQDAAVSVAKLSPGPHRITASAVNRAGQTGSATIAIVVGGGPHIDSVSPIRGPAGTVVTIAGTNFNPTASANTVRFGTLQAEVTSATTTQILTRVPAGITQGGAPITVTAGSVLSNAVDFLVTAPQISIASVLDFGGVNVGERKDLVLPVANTGNIDLTLTAISINDPRFTVVSTAPPVVIPAGQTFMLTLRFSPIETGAASATLTISNSDPARPVATVSLTGTGARSGISAAASIETLPATLDFGQVTVNQTKDLTLGVRNSGNAVLSIASMTSSNARFTFTQPNTVPFNVAPGLSVTVSIRFTPIAAGSQTGTLTIASNDPNRPTSTVSLTGNGISAAATREVTLQLDDGIFEIAIGATGATPNVYFLNRLTPTAYPATLKRIQIYFGGQPGDLPVGHPISYLAATNPSGGSSINGITFQRMPTAIAVQEGFNVLTLATPVTIDSGDFVIGFFTSNQARTFPMVCDQSPPSRQRSYFSTDGVNFEVIDIVNRELSGNFGIRAVVDAPAQ